MLLDTAVGAAVGGAAVVVRGAAVVVAGHCCETHMSHSVALVMKLIQHAAHTPLPQVVSSGTDSGWQGFGSGVGAAVSQQTLQIIETHGVAWLS